MNDDDIIILYTIQVTLMSNKRSKSVLDLNFEIKFYKARLFLNIKRQKRTRTNKKKKKKLFIFVLTIYLFL